MNLKNFKKGDNVVMHTCMEAKHHDGKVWICETDSFQRDSKLPKDQVPEVVFLEGLSGSFWCNFLQIIKS